MNGVRCRGTNSAEYRVAESSEKGRRSIGSLIFDLRWGYVHCVWLAYPLPCCAVGNGQHDHDCMIAMIRPNQLPVDVAVF
jgi:hypothetical protein